MMLFEDELVDNLFKRAHEQLVKHVAVAALLIIQIRQAQRIAERVGLIFLFPRPVAAARSIRIGVVMADGRVVEGIGVGIAADHFQLRGKRAANKFAHLRAFGRQAQIRRQLLGGIAVPHGGNIAGIKENGAVRPAVDRRLQRAGVAVAEQLPHLFIANPRRDLFHILPRVPRHLVFLLHNQTSPKSGFLRKGGLGGNPSFF